MNRKLDVSDAKEEVILGNGNKVIFSDTGVYYEYEDNLKRETIVGIGAGVWHSIKLFDKIFTISRDDFRNLTRHIENNWYLVGRQYYNIKYLLSENILDNILLFFNLDTYIIREELGKDLYGYTKELRNNLAIKLDNTLINYLFTTPGYEKLAVELTKYMRNYADLYSKIDEKVKLMAELED